MKHIRKRLTYANVMSSIAVFVVLGGAAFAAVQLPKNSVGTKQLKKNAVSKAKIKKNAVVGSKVQNGSLSAADIGGAVNDSSALGGKAASAYQGKEHWALVHANGTEILAQSGGISLVGHITGGYGIRFPVPTENAAIQATPTTAGFAGTPAGAPLTLKSGPCPASIDCTAITGLETANDALVITFKAETLTDMGFYIT
ncbi:MAG TPA: hypothetical protein VFM51_00440, partial [Solirubrobacterales bacterium]|nr:hypothetical protein [Solirubrobacterales bacterium]